MDKNNFWISTRATFHACAIPHRPADFVSVSKCGSKSEYWYTPKGVIRCSDHWSRIYNGESGNVVECNRIASCFWILRTNNSKSADFLCGFCEWNKFRPNHKRCGRR